MAAESNEDAIQDIPGLGGLTQAVIALEKFLDQHKSHQLLSNDLSVIVTDFNHLLDDFSIYPVALFSLAERLQNLFVCIANLLVNDHNLPQLKSYYQALLDLFKPIPTSFDWLVGHLIEILQQQFDQHVFDFHQEILLPKLSELSNTRDMNSRAALCYQAGIILLYDRQYTQACICLIQAYQICDHNAEIYRPCKNAIASLPSRWFFDKIIQSLSSEEQGFLTFLIDKSKDEPQGLVTLLRKIELTGDKLWYLGDFTNAQKCYQVMREILKQEQKVCGGQLPESITGPISHYINKQHLTGKTVNYEDSPHCEKNIIEYFTKPSFLLNQQLLTTIRHPTEDNLARLPDELAATIAALMTTHKNTQSGYQALIRHFISYLVTQCETIIGSAPCQFCLMGMGSLARGEFCAYSDLEYALIYYASKVPAHQQHWVEPYFSYFVELFAMMVVSLGETNALSAGERLYEFADAKVGFHLDELLVPQSHTDQTSPGIRLYGDVASMVVIHHPIGTTSSPPNGTTLSPP